MAVKYLLEHHQDKINYSNFSQNANKYAIKHLLENKDRINYMFLSRNPSIFTLSNRDIMERLGWGGG
jgi:hypothetical protein